MRTPISVTLIALFAASAAAEEVNVYSSRHYNTDQALYDDFTEATGITVNLIEAKGDALIERLAAEGESSPADVFITVDGSRIARAVEAGLFQPISSEALTSAIPENLRHPDGLWFGLSTRVRGIVYATDRVDASEISTYEDLADPAWSGRICIRSSSNVYNQSLVASMIAADGLEAAESWANSIVANMARAPQGGDTDQIKAVAAGECDVAVAKPLLPRPSGALGQGRGQCGCRRRRHHLPEPGWAQWGGQGRPCQCQRGRRGNACTQQGGCHPVHRVFSDTERPGLFRRWQ